MKNLCEAVHITYKEGVSCVIFFIFCSMFKSLVTLRSSVKRCSGSTRRRLWPALESVIEVGVIGAKDKHDVEPALREEVTAVVVNNHAPLGHLVLQFIHNLEGGKKSVKGCESNL